MRVSILTLFPETFQGVFNQSIINRAVQQSLVDINLVNLRNFATDSHKTVDDTPFGGGAGMVLKVDVIRAALEELSTGLKSKPYKILLSSSGKKYNQRQAVKLSRERDLILICGHYEGVDERVLNFIDLELTIGDYVLSGGEIPAMVVIDSVVRLLPGALGEYDSLKEESFNEFELKGKKVRLVEYAQYTRPAVYKGLAVPKVLLSGNHEEIKKWRLQSAFEKTKRNRPDLLTGLTHFLSS